MKRELVVTNRIRDYVKNFLKANGLKQGFLAEEMGYSEKKFSRLINGGTVFTIDDLAIFCTYFEISADTFIFPREDDIVDASKKIALKQP